MFVDEDLQIPTSEDCGHEAVHRKILKIACARQASGFPRVPKDAPLQIRGCYALRRASTGGLLGFSANVTVDEVDQRAAGSNHISLFLDDDGALARVDEKEAFRDRTPAPAPGA